MGLYPRVLSFLREIEKEGGLHFPSENNSVCDSVFSCAEVLSVSGFLAIILRFWAGRWFILGVKEVVFPPVYPRVLHLSALSATLIFLLFVGARL